MSYVRREASNAKIREDVMPSVVSCYSLLDQVKRSVYTGDLKKATKQVSTCMSQLNIVQNTIKLVARKSKILAMTRLTPKAKKYKNKLRKQIRKGRIIIMEINNYNTHDV